MARADDLVLLRRLQAGVRRGSRQIRALSVTWGLPSPGRPFSEARARQRRHGHRRSTTDPQHGPSLKYLTPTPTRPPHPHIPANNSRPTAFTQPLTTDTSYPTPPPAHDHHPQP